MDALMEDIIHEDSEVDASAAADKFSSGWFVILCAMPTS